VKKSLFETLLSFLLGTSWAVLILGSLLTFKTFLDFGIFASIFSTIIFIFITLFFILVLETMNLYRDGHEEKRKQTKLLYDIRELLKKENVNCETREAPLGDD
jgi:large-conductance mechanosensitive channel